MKTTRLLALLALIVAGILHARGQDAYDKALESFSRIAAEADLKTGRNMQADVDYIRKFKIEMPEAERLRMAKKRIERLREERFGARIEKAGTKRRSASENNVGTPKSGVRWNNGSGQSRIPKQPSKAALERDIERTQKAIDGARDVHAGTKVANEKVHRDVADSEAMSASFNSTDHSAGKGRGRVDYPDFAERGNDDVKNLDLMTGLDDESESADRAVPKDYDINELLERFERDPYLLDCDELDYVIDYLKDKIDEKLAEKERETINNNTNQDEDY